jgi:DNA-binding NtrC family response regulator
MINLLTPSSIKHVLIVDDEPHIREMLSRAVREMGFEAIEARSAEHATKLLADGATSPLIILLDLNLPGMDGLEFMRQLRSRDQRSQIIVLTGFGSIEAAQVAIRHDTVDFLTKPCPLEELERALARAQQRAAAGMLSHDCGTESPPCDADDPGIVPLKELEHRHILAALDRRHGNRAAAAADLGISERTLYYHLARYSTEAS